MIVRPFPLLAEPIAGRSVLPLRFAFGSKRLLAACTIRAICWPQTTACVGVAEERDRLCVRWTQCKKVKNHGHNGAAPDANHSSDRKSTRLNSSHLGISYAVF